jgi:hypothetical protein
MYPSAGPFANHAVLPSAMRSTEAVMDKVERRFTCNGSALVYKSLFGVVGRVSRTRLRYSATEPRSLEVFELRTAVA